MKQILKYILFLFPLIILLLPEWYLPILTKNKPAWQSSILGGTFQKTDRPAWEVPTWLMGRFQDKYEEHLKTQSTNASFFVRRRNQLYYQLFESIPSANVTAGKENTFHQTFYCNEYIGQDFKGHAFLEELAKKVEKVNQSLLQKGKHLLVLLPPGKARVLPHTLPTFYQKNASRNTNWEVFSKLLEEKKIPYLNYQAFIDSPDQYEHPIYPQLGLHWSYYGAAVAAELSKQKIEQLLDKKLPKMDYSEVELSTKLKGEDRELLNGANLMHFPEILPMPYPTISYQSDSSTYKPRVLIVGDSFYKLQFNLGVQQALFDEQSSFWYYNSNSLPQGKRVNQENLQEVIESTEIILLSHAEINIHRTGFGFLDQLIALFEEEELKK